MLITLEHGSQPQILFFKLWSLQLIIRAKSIANVFFPKLLGEWKIIELGINPSFLINDRFSVMTSCPIVFQ